ncbi:MAG TPA: MBL fold metallo-hydrolase [Candidatus Rifleibacterium sp.]|nr:MBL fold metallo-hydrolase [Candidatus Rifleibacterium sp.]
MIIKFWGVRGSIPVPGKDTVEFGGNTTCIEVLTSDHERIIFDAGTGIRVLGNSLMQQEFGQGKGVAHIFFTHSHWDHIQGFPFFTPAYIGKKDNKGNRIDDCCNEFNLYGASDVGNRIETTLRGQMDNYYFPVDLNYLSSKINFKNLVDNRVQIGKATVTAFKLVHPNGVLGYRIEEEGKCVAIATDCEHPTDGSIDQNLLSLARNVDVLIYDGQYTCDEYAPHKFNLPGPGKQGFGHSTPEEGIRAAKAAGAKRLIITHHDPLHNDEKLKEMETQAKKLFNRTEFAREGMIVEI